MIDLPWTSHNLIGLGLSRVVLALAHLALHFMWGLTAHILPAHIDSICRHARDLLEAGILAEPQVSHIEIRDVALSLLFCANGAALKHVNTFSRRFHLRKFIDRGAYLRVLVRRSRPLAVTLASGRDLGTMIVLQIAPATTLDLVFAGRSRALHLGQPVTRRLSLGRGFVGATR